MRTNQAIDRMPEGLREAYRSFLKEGRILLTGHSHQAWPDVSERAQMQAFHDAATHVDDKWGAAVQPIVDRVARGVLERLGYGEGEALVFGQNTHELAFRLLSAFPFDNRTRVVTTGGEFHSLDRQLRRIEEEGVQVTWGDAGDKRSLGARLVEAIEPGTSLVAVSSVFFEDGAVLEGLDGIAAKAQEVGAALLIDAYHAFNIVPMQVADLPGEVYAMAGGYKYAQFGEACCFMRIPPGSERRPLQTGWFADFASLAKPRGEGPRPVGYGEGASRFAGSTYDASPFYRAAAVLDHFDRFGLSVERLRAISLRQTGRILETLQARGAEAGLEIVSPLEAARRGGFVAVRNPSAQALVGRLREVGVFTDARGEILRLGPAPYLLDEEIDRGVEALLEVARVQ